MYSIIIFSIDLILSNINMGVKYGKDVCTPLTNRELECNDDGQVEDLPGQLESNSVLCAPKLIVCTRKTLTATPPVTTAEPPKDAMAQ